MILVLSQRDIHHPGAGGAEHYTHQALKLLAQDREVVHIGSGHASLPAEERIDGIRYIRGGGGLAGVIWFGYRYYRARRADVELVIDHSNTHQFFTFLWARDKRVFFIHQLTQEIWTYFYGRLAGRTAWAFENALLRASRGRAITVSESTRLDLLERGFEQIALCQEGNEPRRGSLPPANKDGTLLYVGRLVPYKRVEDAIRVAAELGKKLVIIGRGSAAYERKLKLLTVSLQADCEFKGFVPKAEKERVMEQAELLLMPSVREGWGLVITEAANLGTPALVYDVPGTSEAVQYGSCGFIADELNWTSMAEAYRRITPEAYAQVRERAFAFSLTLSWETTARQFRDAVNQYAAEAGRGSR